MQYEFLFKLRDLISPSLMQVQGRFDGVLGRMRGGMSRFQGIVGRAGQSIGQLRDRLMGLAGANRTIDGLNKRLDSLQKKRSVAVDDGEITRLDAKIKATLAHLEKLKQEQEKAGNGGKEKGGLLGKVSGMAMPYLGAAALAAGGLSFVNAGMDREQTKVAFEQFVGKQGIDPLMGQLNKFADVTPYSNEDVYGSARTLLSAKVSQKDLNARMMEIGNMSAVSQKDFGEMSAAYAKILQKGFLDSGELHQEFGGTLLMDQLKKNLGVDGEGLFKMAEKRQVRASDMQKAISDLSASGGMYAGGLDKLSATAGGKWSTFLGTLENKFATWAEGLNQLLGRLFDFGTALLSKIDPMLEKLQPVFAVVQEGFIKVWEATAPVRELFGQLWQVVVNLFSSFGSLTGGATGLSVVFDVLAAVVWTISKALQFVGQLVLWLADSWLVKLIGVVWLGVQAWTALNVVMAANPIMLAVVAIAALVSGIKYAYDHFEGFRKKVIQVWEAVKTAFATMGTVLKALLMPTAANISAAVEAVRGAWNKGMAAGDAAYRADHDKRFGTQAERRASRGKRLATATNPTGAAGAGAANKPGASGAGGKGTVGDKAGLSATTGGTKSMTVNIHLEALVKGLTMNVANASMGVEQLRDMVMDELTRVLAGAQNAATHE